MPKIFECQFITLSEELSQEDYEVISDMITNYFTWGDTSMCLVNQDDFKRVIARRNLTDQRMSAVERLEKILDQLGDSTYINLY